VLAKEEKVSHGPCGAAAVFFPSSKQSVLIISCGFE
jgi:hypothetical protein